MLICHKLRVFSLAEFLFCKDANKQNTSEAMEFFNKLITAQQFLQVSMCTERTLSVLKAVFKEDKQNPSISTLQHPKGTVTWLVFFRKDSPVVRHLSTSSCMFGMVRSTAHRSWACWAGYLWHQLQVLYHSCLCNSADFVILILVSHLLIQNSF